MELGEFEISYKSLTYIKGKNFADFIVEFFAFEYPAEEKTLVSDHNEVRSFHVDRSSNARGKSRCSLCQFGRIYGGTSHQTRI